MNLILIGFPQDHRKRIQKIAIKLDTNYNVNMMLIAKDQSFNTAIS